MKEVTRGALFSMLADGMWESSCFFAGYCGVCDVGGERLDDGYEMRVAWVVGWNGGEESGLLSVE